MASPDVSPPPAPESPAPPDFAGVATAITRSGWTAGATVDENLDEIREDLGSFGNYVFGWPPAPHHKIWVTLIERLIRRQLTFEDGTPCKRLLIIAPPASAKTNWVGIATIAWLLGHRSNDHVLYLSAAQDQAKKSALAVRDTVDANPRFQALFPDVVPDKRKGWAAHRWFLSRPEHPGDKDPSMLAAGVGSQIVLGSRADVIVFDDINTQENTATQYRRDKVRDWVKDTAFSRETADAIHLGVMTRWSPDDIAPYLKSAGYMVVTMPALGYWDDEGVEGEALWPEMYDRAYYLDKLRDQGPAGFSRMYQGDPQPEGGATFRESDFMPYYAPFVNPGVRNILLEAGISTAPPYDYVVQPNGDRLHLTQRVLSVDTAFEDSEGADYTVMACWGVGMDQQAYLLGLFREQVDAADLYGLFINMAKVHQPDLSLIEKRASGIQLIQDLQRKTRMSVIPINPITNKEERAKAQSHVVRGAFRVPHPEMFRDAQGELWVAGVDTVIDQYTLWSDQQVIDFVQEHVDFPRGRHDDQVDSTTQAAAYLRPFLTWWAEEIDDVTNEMPDMEQALYRESPIPVGAMPMAGPEAVMDTDYEFGVAMPGWGIDDLGGAPGIGDLR